MNFSTRLVFGFLGLLVSSFNASANSSERFYENSSSTPLLSALASATRSIDIEIYEMDDALVQAAIRNALGRGVRVRVVQEPTPVGASCKLFNPKTAQDSASCATQKDLMTTIRASGGMYVPYNHAALCAVPNSQCFEHGKMVIVDQSQVLLSTGNFNSTNLCNASENPTTCNRDYTVMTTDAEARSLLQTIFEKDLIGNAYSIQGILSSSNVAKVTVSPYSLAPMVAFIESAKSEILIQNQYLKDPQMNAAIFAAAKRGVNVQVMVASNCSFGKPSASENRSWQKLFEQFDAAGVKTRIFTRKILVRGVSGYLHAKSIVVDQTRAWVGSVNGSTTSLSNNREYGIFLDEVTEVKKLSAFMKSDFNDPNGETWQESMTCKNDPFVVAQNNGE